MKKVTLFFIVLSIAFTSFAQLKMQKTKILIVADGSHSMMKSWDNRTKIDAMRIALTKFIDKCSNYGEIELALRAYGHQYSTTENKCEDSKLEIPFEIGNSSKIKIFLNKLSPRGTSAVGYTLSALHNDLPKDDFHKKVIVFLTDGADACKQDVCAAYKTLKENNNFKGIYIIGLNLNEDELKMFQCIGDFINTTSEQSLKSTLDKIFGEIKPY